MQEFTAKSLFIKTQPIDKSGFIRSKETKQTSSLVTRNAPAIFARSSRSYQLNPPDRNGLDWWIRNRTDRATECTEIDNINKPPIYLEIKTTAAMEKHFEQLVLETKEAELGKLFGKSCGKINKKAFVAFYKEEMVFKLGKETVDVLLEKYEGSKNWDPSEKKRGMKDWIQVPQKYKADWKELTKKAVKYFELSAK